MRHKRCFSSLGHQNPIFLAPTALLLLDSDELHAHLVVLHGVSFRRFLSATAAYSTHLSF